MKTCLVIIFNHKYIRNIEKLKLLYSKRFSCIKIIMPFYDGSDEDVITVYESSYEFQGMVAQASERLLATNANYYFFISDDLILNPIITEENFLQKLNMERGDAFHRGVFELHKSKWNVERINEAIDCFEVQKHTEFSNELMEKDSAIDKMKSYGYGNMKISQDDKKTMSDWKGFGRKYGRLRANAMKHRKQMPYPLLGGYSDWFILPREDLSVIASKFGITAAMGLFVEIAIPTIMYLYCKHVKRLNETNFKDGAIWDPSVLEEFGNQYHWDIKELLENFPEEKLYIHPIKLSKWWN